MSDPMITDAEWVYLWTHSAVSMEEARKLWKLAQHMGVSLDELTTLLNIMGGEYGSTYRVVEKGVKAVQGIIEACTAEQLPTFRESWSKLTEPYWTFIHWLLQKPIVRRVMKVIS